VPHGHGHRHSGEPAHDRPRGPAFGATLAAFDTGIGTGASFVGWSITAHGFRNAFGIAGVLAALALPSFLLAERRLGFSDSGRP
jgi:predicted MFS family arabinose efflux permease